MNHIIHGPAARRALAVGLVAGAWLVLSASSHAAETSLPAGAAAAAADPDRIRLAQAGAVPVERPVSYASEQADRGEVRYMKECLDCHGNDLKGGMNGGAPLRGLAFEGKFFDGLPASVLYSFMSSAMPPNSPGRYSPNSYADLMAYVLKRNGVGTGAPLPSDADALDNLIMEK